MLSICDQLSLQRPIGRRDFLQIGGLGLGGLSLGTLAGRSAAAGVSASPVTGKSVIVLFQQGGPPQHETFDPKVDVPSEIASVGGQIATSLSGVRFGDSLPRLAKLAHRLAVVRNYRTNTDHGGMLPVVSDTTGGANIGSVYARVAGTNHADTGLPNSMFLIPKSVDSEQKTLGSRFGQFDATGNLGAAYAPFVPGAKGPLEQAMRLNLLRHRFDDRRELLRRLDNARRRLDSAPAATGVDGLRRQAMELILKGMVDAFDLSKEDPRTLARYDTSGYYDPAQWTDAGGKAKNNVPWYTAHTKTLGKLLLMARRLCEAGCGLIVIHSEFVWDFHSDVNNVAIEQGKRLVVEPFDHAVSAFVEDCEARGLSDDILLVCCGEMGRTPKLNKRGGRDHWPKLAPLMLYGGGLTDGQVIGRSTKTGSEADGAETRSDHLLATIFNTLIDYGQARLIPDLPAPLKTALNKIEKTPAVL